MTTEPFDIDSLAQRQPGSGAGSLGVPAPPRPAICETPDFSIIARDIKLRQSLHSTTPIRIAGGVIGEVACPWVEIDTGAQVLGNVRTNAITLRGTVAGCIQGDSVLIAGSARVRGSVDAKRLRAECGAMIEGRTFPAIHFQGPPARDLARIARRPKAATKIHPACLRMLKAQGLVFERQDVVFVTIHGLQALDRSFWPRIGSVLERRHWKRHEQGLLHDDCEALLCMKSANPDLTRVARDLHIACDIATGGDLHIAGSVTGNLRGRACTVDYGAYVDGNIRAGSVTLCGHVTGSVAADDIVLDPSARVEGMVGFGAGDVGDAANRRHAEQLTWTGPVPAKSPRQEARDASGVAARVDALLSRLGQAA